MISKQLQPTRAPVLERRLVRALCAAASGVALAWSFPDVAIGWLAFFALAPLIAAVVSASTRREAFLLGWLAYSITWILTVPWVIKVMSENGGLPYPLGVAIFVMMSLWLGLNGGVFALIVSSLRLGRRFSRWLLVPLAWCALEYSRTYLFSGFPWNLITAAIVDYVPLVRLDRLIGPYALGCLVNIPALALAWMWVQSSRSNRAMPMTEPAASRRLWRVPIGAAAMMLVWFLAGMLLLRSDASFSQGREYRAALIQPNFSQQMRWSSSELAEIFQRMTRLTETAAAIHPDVVVWPESTVPLTYESTDFFRSWVERTSAQNHFDIILGSVAQDAKDPAKLWNSAYLVSDGRTIGHYDKIRLVPFGEYVPMRKLLFFAEKLVHDVGDFQFGTRDTPLVGKLRYGPAICYEIVFPRIAAQQVLGGAEVLVTITNDAWYDRTAAPRQHLNQARLRAIETDREILRAGTTGISAFIDTQGRIVESLDMDRQGILFPTFHPRHSLTPYVRFGDWFAWVACAIVLAALVQSAVRSRQ
jgi:apolipoprotein N-acyltransferase